MTAARCCCCVVGRSRPGRLQGLAHVAGGAHETGQAGLGLGVGAGLEAAVGVDPDLLGSQGVDGPLEQVGALGLAGYTRGVDVPHAQTELAQIGRAHV